MAEYGQNNMKPDKSRDILWIPYKYDGHNNMNIYHAMHTILPMCFLD